MDLFTIGMARSKTSGGAADYHICSSSEYSSVTGLPIVSNPVPNRLYLVPINEGSGNNHYNEYYYKNGNWELFGNGTKQIEFDSSPKSGSENAVTSGGVHAALSEISGDLNDLEARVNNIISAVGSPLIATTAADMTNIDKVYVYQGSETGYTAGNWYYYNGTAWASGGVYNAAAVNTDKTLSVENSAADAKVVGDSLNNLINVSTTQPSGSDNRLWINPNDNDTIEIPTQQEMVQFETSVESNVNGLSESFAPRFDDATAYSAGDYVVNGGVLYKFKSNHAAGAWTGNDVTAIKVMDEMLDRLSVLTYTDGGKTNLNDIVDNLPVDSILHLSNSNIYTVSKTLNLNRITIFGNGCKVIVKRDDENFVFDNSHKHAIVVNSNVNIFDVNFEFGYKSSAEQFPVVTSIKQRGLTILGSNVSIERCNFSYTQCNTILVYGENVHNVRIADVILDNCANGIQCETAADLTGPDYAVTFENCYVKAHASASGIGTALFVGCTFEQRSGGNYPNFQAGINDAEVEIGSITTCINCRFIGNTTMPNVIVYGYNTIATHKHRGLGHFIGCNFSGGPAYAIKVCGNALFETCTFYKGIAPDKVTGTEDSTIHITLMNCIYHGTEGIDGIQYLVGCQNNVPVYVCMIGCSTSKDSNSIRLIGNISSSSGENVRLTMINNTSGVNDVANLKTQALWFNNRTHSGGFAHNISIVNILKYRWITDILPTNIPSSSLEDSSFLANAYGVYYFDDNTLRFVGVNRKITLYPYQS